MALDLLAHHTLYHAKHFEFRDAGVYLNPEGKKRFFAAYDITDPKRLHKVAKLCEDYGMRIQHSFFECRLEANHFDEFWTQLTNLISAPSDRITSYKICAACAKEIREADTQIQSEKVVACVF